MSRTFNILCLMVLTCFAAQGQVIRFTDTTNSWRILGYSFSNGLITSARTDAFGPDTVIHQVRYRRLGNSPELTLALREDTASGKVYFRFVAAKFGLQVLGLRATDTAEHVLFDYTLRLQDTLNIDFDTSSFRYQVVALDSVLISGRYYKVFNLQQVVQGGLFSYLPVGGYLVEGIGMTSFPLALMLYNGFESGAQLRCFTTRGQAPALDKGVPVPSPAGPVMTGPPLAYSFDNTASCNLAVADIRPVTITASIAPHPVTAGSKILLPAPVHGAIFHLYDASGRMIRCQKVDGTSIPIGAYDLPAGTYCYRLTDVRGADEYKGPCIVSGF